ncbi:DUF2628 domain-containing protein [Cytobacillus oceanisediminis]|uniref:DUF2628 domain-containing protein n=1 Tax=Cytobacillus oceanisediminis TaxID=665099 RepID=UPI001FB307A9|nr:DUF2628 domain-containing protein [Cytobacillus oceanisediminis]UOE58213.1 DUF2628 domain-containing protein [Cytobacillus oceanisediminis]
MFCTSCGTQLREQDSFCSKCGRSVNPTVGNTALDIDQEAIGQESEDFSLEQKLEEAFVGKNYDTYIDRWDRLEEKNGRISWNWATFLFGPFWFGYRKMYVPLLFILVAYLFVDLILYATGSDLWNLFIFPLTIILAMFGNYIYLKHTNKHINKANLTPLNNEQKMFYLKRKGGTSWLGVLFTVISLLIYGVLTAFIFPTDEDKIMIVKNGSFYDYPTTTVGNAFEDYFSEPEWEYVSGSAYDIVRFTGYDLSEEGNDIEVTMDFIITDDSFEAHSAWINQNKLSEDDMLSLLDSLLSGR